MVVVVLVLVVSVSVMIHCRLSGHVGVLVVDDLVKALNTSLMEANFLA